MIVDAYIRVSQVGGRSGERFMSPAVQREQIEGWAKLRGALIANVFEEFDESGGRPDRPLLLEAIARVEQGQSQGLVVAYLSRFGRSLVDALDAIRRITDAGGTFVSVQEGLDFSTDTGRLVMRVLLSFAEWERDRIRATWDTARGRAVARGVRLGLPPTGYLCGPDGRLEVDPETGPLVTEVFRRCAAGATIRDLHGYLVEQGVRTKSGRPGWHLSLIRRVLENRVYRGELRHGAFLNRTAHPPLVDEATWQCAQPAGREYPERRPAQRAFLWGLLRCAGCKRVLHSTMCDRGTSTEHHQYMCGTLSNPGTCPAPAAITDSRVDPYVEAVFWEALARRRPRTGRQLERLRATVDAREAELEAYRDHPALPRTLGPDRFARGLAVRTNRAEKALLELSKAELAAAPEPPSPEELRTRWPLMSASDRRDAIATVIGAVFVERADKGSVPVERRLSVCLRGRGPKALSGDTRHAPVEATPFDPTSCPPATRLAHAEPDWTNAEVSKSLTPFLEGRDRWPSFTEFQAAGLTRLYTQIQRHAGTRHWAALTGLPYVRGRADGGGWTEARLRAGLRDYLAGRTDWPTFAEFRADRREALRLAVRAHGGPERWAREFGLRLTPHQRQLERWTYARMKTELAAFAGHRTDWPPLMEFQAAGRELLYRAIIAKRAREQLAADVGLRLPKGMVVPATRWTDDAIKRELDRFLDGRDRWPTRGEFQAADLGGLQRRLQRTRSAATWARRYGLKARPYAIRSRGPRRNPGRGHG